MLAADATVVVDQPVHRLRQGDDLRGALDLQPGSPDKGIGEHTQHRIRIAAQVTNLIGGLAAADDHLAVAVHPDGDWRGLHAPSRPPGDQHGPVVAGDERSCLVGSWHRFSHIR